MDSTHILLVEDNPGDVRLIEQAFAERELPGTLHAVKTGKEALDRLYRRGEFTDAPHVEVVLLDLNLPDISGSTVLKEIKSDPGLRRLPVIILTGSVAGNHVRKAYEDGANAYVTKPTDPAEFTDRIQRIAEFWADIVRLPSDVTDGS